MVTATPPTHSESARATAIRQRKSSKPSSGAAKAARIAAKGVRLLETAQILFAEAAGWLEAERPAPAKHLGLLSDAAKKLHERAAATQERLFPAPARAATEA